MNGTVGMVEEFHKHFNVVTHMKPCICDKYVNALRLRILREEIDELEEALNSQNVVLVLDALTDIQYVLDGTYLSLGFAELKNAAFVEVHRSNMSKLGKDGKPVYREDGKVLKGQNYVPPNLAKLL